MSLAGGVAGVPNAMNEAKADALIEHKRDIEKELWSNQDSRPDDGVNGSKMRGMGRWIYDGVATLTLDAADPSPTTGYFELPVPSDVRTPANQIYTGSIAALTQAQFDGLIQAKYENTGASSDLRGFVNPIVKNRVGFFSRYQPDVTTYSSRVFVSTGFLEGKHLFGADDRRLQERLGHVRVVPDPVGFHADSVTGLLPGRWRSRGCGVPGHTDTSDLPNMGGGLRSLIQSIPSYYSPAIRERTAKLQEQLNSLIERRKIQWLHSEVKHNEKAVAPGYSHIAEVTADTLRRQQRSRLRRLRLATGGLGIR
jgi:hypothetical protein